MQDAQDKINAFTWASCISMLKPCPLYWFNRNLTSIVVITSTASPFSFVG